MKVQWNWSSPKAIFLLSTEELAWSIYYFLLRLLPWTGLLPQPLIEDSEEPESDNPSAFYPLIIATPKTILDAVKRENVELKQVDYVFFDRADCVFYYETIGDQLQSFCKTLGSKNGVRVLTSVLDIPQDIANLCLRSGPHVQVRSSSLRKKIVLKIFGRCFYDEQVVDALFQYIGANQVENEQDRILVKANRLARNFNEYLCKYLRENGDLPFGYNLDIVHNGKNKEVQKIILSSFIREHAGVLICEEFPDLEIHKASTAIFLYPPTNLDAILTAVNQLQPNGSIVIFMDPQSSSDHETCQTLSHQWDQTQNNGGIIWDNDTILMGPCMHLVTTPSSRVNVVGLPASWSNWKVLAAMSRHNPLDIDRKMKRVGWWEQIGIISFQTVYDATSCFTEWNNKIIGGHIIQMSYDHALGQDEGGNEENDTRRKSTRRKRVKL